MPVNAPVEPRVSLWVVELLIDAFRGCSLLTTGILATVLVLVVGGGAILSFRYRSASVVAVALPAFVLVAWAFRDRLLLLADSRLWVGTAQAFGRDVPLHNSILGSKIMGFVGSAGGDTMSAGTALALLSISCGGLTALTLWWASGRWRLGGGSGVGPLLIFAMVFGQPLSFIFYGHVETYAVFALAMALFLASLGRDIIRGQPGFPTVILFLILVLTHYIGFLVVLPILVIAGSKWRHTKRVVVPYLAILALVIIGVLLPPFGRHALLNQGWTAAELMVYTTDVLNGWVLGFVPAGIFCFVLRKPVLGDPFARFLGLTVLTYALLPFLVVFELGMYRDLDLLTPAFVAFTFLAVYIIARSETVSRKLLVMGMGSGCLFLASLLSLTICSAGTKTLEKQLERGTMVQEKRSYGFEALAFHHRDEGRLAEAEAAMGKAIALTPGNHRLWGPMGEFQLARGDTVNALSSLLKSMNTPRAPRTAPLLAELLIETGKPREAIRLLELRRTELLGDSQAAAALAVAYFRVDLPESTVAVAKARLTLAPRDDAAHFNAASGLAMLGRYGEAEIALRTAITLAPERPGYHRALVQLLLRMPGGEARAREHLESLDSSVREAVVGER